jgi:hypothetical protein
LPSLGVRRPLTFHILIFSSETPQPNELKRASHQISVRFGTAVSEKKATNLKQELPVAAMFINGSKRNEQSLLRTFHRCFLPSFISFGQAVSEDKLF